MNPGIRSVALLRQTFSGARRCVGQHHISIFNHYSSNSTGQYCSKTKGISDSDNSKEQDIAPCLQTLVNNNCDKMSSNDIVPGKGRPPEPPVDCCMSGCVNCVWIQYAEELKQYYSDGSDRALKEIDKIENQSLKAFIKLELGLL